jgi:hypothetical protein
MTVNYHSYIRIRYFPQKAYVQAMIQDVSSNQNFTPLLQAAKEKNQFKRTGSQC